MPDLTAAAKALYLHNVADYADPDTAEAAWLLDDDVRAFWLTQARVAAEALRLGEHIELGEN